MTNHKKRKFSVDRIPRSQNTDSQFWNLILCTIENLEEALPFPVGIHHGGKKPSSPNEFLEEYVIEIITLRKDSLRTEKFCDSISSFICDVPVRALYLELNVICQVTAVARSVAAKESILFRMSTRNGRVIFLQVDASLRTDLSFWTAFSKRPSQPQ